MRKLFKERFKSAIYTLLYIGFIILIWNFISSFLVDKETVREIVSGYGILGPFVFILIQIIQNVIAPISHYPILIAGGFIFGPVIGFFLNWIGTVLGTYLIIFLTKKFGRPLVIKMVKNETINKYDNLVKRLSPFGLFLIYYLPVFPDDEITYLIGLSNMPKKSILLAIILGKIGGATWSIVGNDPTSGITPMLLAGIVLFIPCILVYFYKDILNFFKKIILKS